MDSALLADIWRQVGRHSAIGETTTKLGQLLRKHLPFAALWVRQLEPAHRALATVGSLELKSDQPPTPVVNFTPAQWRRLQAWGKQTHGMARLKDGGPTAKLLGVEQVVGDAVAGPLLHDGGFTGVLMLAARPEQRFAAAHLRLGNQLLEPFATALANDHRLHELAALREAAMADRESLLTRLGRRELADVVVGAESGLKSVMQRVALVARSDAPVLLLGETGTGKEVVARALHLRSARHQAPFIRVNCGAIPTELIDSQLFGHEKGSFTGAAEQRQGWFERADGGTLFLDEIGELPLVAQVRLLRVLQDGFLERVGGQQALRVDVRIVAATHRNLAEMVAAKEFREDLWYRLAVFPILLPPLRERRGDIAELARHFAERAATRFGLPAVMPTAEQIELLAQYPWPGNVRELGTVIDRAAILGGGKSLEIATALGVSTATTAPLPETETTPVRQSESVTTLDEAMRSHIQMTLRATHGRIEGPRGAAVRLGVNPHTLRAKMRKLGIDWSQFRS